MSTVPKKKRKSKGTEGVGCGDSHMLVIHSALGRLEAYTAYLECMKPCPKKELVDFANHRLLCTCCSAVRFGRKVQEGIM